MEKIILRYIRYEYSQGRLPTERVGHVEIEGINLNENTPNISTYIWLMKAFTELMDQKVRDGHANSGKLELTIE